MVSFPYSRESRERAKREELARLSYKLEQEAGRLESVRPLLEQARKEEDELLRIKGEIERLRSSRGEGPWVYQPQSGPAYRERASARKVSSDGDDSKKISRRRLLKIGLAAAAGIAATAAGVNFILPSLPDSNDYEGSVHSLSGLDIDGDVIYYADVCHTADESKPRIPMSHLSVGLNNDANYRCGEKGIETGDFALFFFDPEKTYPVGRRKEYSITGEEIWDRCNFGSKMTMRKGNKITNRAWWLDRVIEFE